MSNLAQGSAQSASHAALQYASTDEFMTGAAEFLDAGLDQGEPVLVSVPLPEIGLLRTRLDNRAHRVDWADMAEVGASPGRIVAFMDDFVTAHAGRPVRYLQGLVWAARTAAEQTEAIRHEALINLAFADAPIRVLCTYDSARLRPGVIRSAMATHPLLLRDGHAAPSPVYTARTALPSAYNRPLPRPPADVPALAYRADLTAARAYAARQASRIGLPPARVLDLVLAVGELAANTLRHTDAGGALAIWAAGSELLCQVQDTGHITDPLAGRRRPAANASNGHGLWVVNQLCDLVELRSGPGRTVIRLHMRLK